MSRYDHPCYRHLDSIELHECAECEDIVRDSDTCWHMARPVCPACWLKLFEDGNE